MEFKKCSKCSIEYPATKEYFNFSCGRLYCKCKNCTRKEYKEWYEKNKEYKLQKDENWRNEHKEHCENWRKHHYNENKERLSEWKKEHYNAEKVKQYNKMYYESHLEKYKLKDIKWRKLNPERLKFLQKMNRIRNAEKIKHRKSIGAAIIKGKSHTKDVLSLIEWNYAKEYFNKCCAYCREPRQKLTRDHFIPIEKGGLHDKTNILPVCKHCNSSKQDKDFLQWFKQQAFYSVKTVQNVYEYLSKMK